MKILLIKLLLLTGSFCFSQINFDSLKLELEKENISDSIRFNILHLMAWEYKYQNPDTTIIIMEKGLEIAKKMQSETAIANSYKVIGVAHSIKSNYDKSINYFLKSLDVYEKLFDTVRIVTSCINIGLTITNKGDYPKALEYYFYGLRMAKNLEDKSFLSMLYGNIGITYSKQQKFDKAMDYYSKGVEIDKELNRLNGLSSKYINIGLILQEEKNELDSALWYYSESVKIKEELNDLRGLAIALGNIGDIYSEKQEYIKAEDFLNRAIAIDVKLDNYSGLARYYGILGTMKRKEGDITSSEKYLIKALGFLDKTSDLEMQTIINRELGKTFFTKRDYYNAYMHIEAYIQNKDSLFNEEKSEEIGRLEAGHEYEKQQAIDEAKHLAKLEKQKAVSKEQDKRQKIVIYSVSSGLALVIVFFIFLFNRFQITKKQRDVIEKQKQIVEEKNKEILDSITYAKRLQDAILPSTKVVKSFLMDSFILYKPKDIVAGDFYFMDVVEEKGKKLIYYVAADCTGHGVPGAMVSIVGANGLKRCIKELGIREPGKILDQLSKLVSINFSQSEERIRDGMDLALCCLEFENDQIKRAHYAGANNPLWVINSKRKEIPENGNLFKEGGGFEIKANKQAIGYTENINPFDTHTIELEPGDTLYTFSDGYPDQFGGENGKKLKSANFRKLLFEIQDKTMDEQLSLLDSRFEEWRGDIEQIDDVCVIGVRL